MYKPLCAALLATTMMAAPAFAAQQQPAAQPETHDMTEPQQTGAALTNPDQPGPADRTNGPELAVSQQKIIDSLTKAGLQDVDILDAAYLVQARTSDNDQVLMIVNSEGVPMHQAQKAADASQQTPPMTAKPMQRADQSDTQQPKTSAN